MAQRVMSTLLRQGAAHPGVVGAANSGAAGLPRSSAASLDELVEVVQELLRDAAPAAAWGRAARAMAHQRFGIDRFVSDWDEMSGAVTA